MQKFHDGVSIRRVVLRAQPFHSQVKFCYSGRAHPPEVCNFTWFGGRSPAVRIDGVRNFGEYHGNTMLTGKPKETAVLHIACIWPKIHDPTLHAAGPKYMGPHCMHLAQNTWGGGGA